MLEPFWPQPYLGPLLRGAADIRIYNDLFDKKAGYVAGLKKLYLELFAKKETEPRDLKLTDPARYPRYTVIQFSGFSERFRLLNGWDEFLLREISAITKAKWLEKSDAIAMAPIGIHARLDDFITPNSKDDFYSRGRLRTPITWFINSLQKLREMLGFPAEAFVFSDGREEELKELLNIKGVALIRTGSAISDLLLLSKAKVLIASAGSTFSAWACFLGQMPSITHPGQTLKWFNIENSLGNYIGEFDPESPPPNFSEQIKPIAESFK